jgi:periplasmic protein TonB
MNRQAMFVPSTTLLQKNNSLLVALLIALIVHIVLLLSIRLSPVLPDLINKPIDITLVNTPEADLSEKADFLAQENHAGAGQEVKQPEPEPAISGVEKIQADHSKKLLHTSKEAKPKNYKTQDSRTPEAEKEFITQPNAKKPDNVARKAEGYNRLQTTPKLTAESLQQQIMQLGAEIRQTQSSAQQTKIKFVDSVSTHKYLAAQYVKDWESKVERTGNLNYPEAASRQNVSGTLTMDVGINIDGSIYSIRINKSSGNPELDEAAKNIVRMSAPFPPLPLDLRKEVEVLVITRVWKFSDESGLVTE